MAVIISILFETGTRPFECTIIHQPKCTSSSGASTSGFQRSNRDYYAIFKNENLSAHFNNISDMPHADVFADDSPFTDLFAPKASA